MGKALDVASELRGSPHAITLEKLIAFEKVIWHRDPNTHSDPEVARNRGMSRLIASGQSQLAFFHQLLEEHFEDGWVRGGQISVRWLRPVYLDDTLWACARVEAIHNDGDKKRVELAVWCENQHAEKTSAGTARAYVK